MAANELPFVVKRVKKGRRPHHHGGAWKVAYADFVTAMMAFFLLLWLLNATTEEQRRGIADYFTPSVISSEKSGAGGLLGGLAVSSPGAMTSRTSVPSVSLELRPTQGATDGEDDDNAGQKGSMTDEELARELARREEERFAKAEAELRQAIQEAPDLRNLERNLIIDQTPEGLRIQVVDQEGQPMFPLGSDQMFNRTRRLMARIAQVIRALPNRISVSGHTDAKPYRGRRRGYGNWELSAGRALSSRRALVESGLDMRRIATVVGKADSEPLIPEDPGSARNRRVSIVLLREAGAKGQRPFKRDWTGPRLN